MVHSPRVAEESSTGIPAMYLEYAQRGFRYATSMLHNSADGEEAVHDAFCRLLESSGCNQHDNFAPLFFTTLRNLCIDRIRQQKRRQQVSLDHVAEPIDQSSHDSSESELATVLNGLIGGLPEQWADALKLRIDGELSYDEIADVLGCTRAQTRTWIYRARRELESGLRKYQNGQMVKK